MKILTYKKTITDLEGRLGEPKKKEKKGPDVNNVLLQFCQDHPELLPDDMEVLLASVEELYDIPGLTALDYDLVSSALSLTVPQEWALTPNMILTKTEIDIAVIRRRRMGKSVPVPFDMSVRAETILGEQKYVATGWIRNFELAQNEPEITLNLEAVKHELKAISAAEFVEKLVGLEMLAEARHTLAFPPDCPVQKEHLKDHVPTHMRITVKKRMKTMEELKQDDEDAPREIWEVVFISFDAGGLDWKIPLGEDSFTIKDLIVSYHIHRATNAWVTQANLMGNIMISDVKVPMIAPIEHGKFRKLFWRLKPGFHLDFGLLQKDPIFKIDSEEADIATPPSFPISRRTFEYPGTRIDFQVHFIMGKGGYVLRKCFMTATKPNAIWRFSTRPKLELEGLGLTVDVNVPMSENRFISGYGWGFFLLLFISLFIYLC